MFAARSQEDTVWDVAVIGGGAAGMMAAATAAKHGARVILLEKNKTLGKKLLITGGGRCNVTNAEFDNKKLLAKFKHGGKFLASPFTQWSSRDTIEFFNSRNVPTKEENEKRVFPRSNSARSVWDGLVAYIKETNVTVMSNAKVLKLENTGENITSAALYGGKVIHAKSFILATGGTSHPETGSTGDGYRFLRELGHRVSETGAALVPIALKYPERGARAAGTGLIAKVSVFQNGEKQLERTGKILFTHVGLSGPCILNMSRDIGELLAYGSVFLELDLAPDLGYEKVNESLQNIFKIDHNKKIRNALKTLVPAALVPLLLEDVEIDSETPCNSVTRDERVRLMKALKHLRFEVDHLLGMDKAVITSGGVELSEVDFKTMRSIKYNNLFLVGDILNIDRPSGGYSLQLCWTTGFVAGNAAASFGI